MSQYKAYVYRIYKMFVIVNVELEINFSDTFSLSPYFPIPLLCGGAVVGVGGLRGAADSMCCRDESEQSMAADRDRYWH